MKFDHVGIVVPEIDDGRLLLSEMFGIQKWSVVFEDSGIGVFVQFGIGPDGPCYELIAPRGTSSPILAALKSGKGIINHLAYRVSHLESAANDLQETGCLAVTFAQPAVAFEGKLVQFFRSPQKFIVELVEAPEDFDPFQRT